MARGKETKPQTPELSAQEQEIANVKRNLKQVETRKVDPMVQIREEARSRQTPELSAQEQEIANVKRNLKQVETRKVDPMVQIREEARKRKLQSESLAQDTVIFGDNNASTQSRSRPNISVNANDAIDPITQAIRDQIITSQHLFLQQEIGKTMENPEKEQFLNKDLVAIRAFLQTDEGKLAVKDVMKNPQAQAQMHKIETTGYKFVHNKFNDRFRDVDWGARSENRIRSTDVTNDAGEAVCTLRETTFDTKPTVVTLEDGTTRTIKSYRQIDFPKELETGNGPLHLSMAVKDENGKNIAEKDAVYFTAHYDDNGKLTEVSSPTPVKFSGRGDDAVGYIERNGKVYTLPVTQGKYREMMMEVAKNKGTNVDISQELEASDRIIQPKAKLRPVNRQVEEQEQHEPNEFEKQLRAQKAKLKPANQRRLADKPQQDPTLEQIIQAKKKNLNKTGRLEAEGLIDSSNVEAEQSQHLNVFTGNLVSPAVIQKVEQIRTNLGSPVVRANSPVEENMTALEMLNGKSTQQAKKIIHDAVKRGDADLVGSMMEVLQNPPPDASIPSVGKVALKKIYTDNLESSFKMQESNRNQSAKMQRACGKLAPRAEITDHARRVNEGSREVSR